MSVSDSRAVSGIAQKQSSSIESPSRQGEILEIVSEARPEPPG